MMALDIVTYAGALVLLLGSVFILIASLGVLRMPDMLSRMHSASKAGAVGGGLVLLAVALLCFDAGIALRAVMAIVFLLLTTPIAAHLLAKASYRITDQSHDIDAKGQLKSKSSPSSTR